MGNTHQGGFAESHASQPEGDVRGGVYWRINPDHLGRGDLNALNSNCGNHNPVKKIGQNVVELSQLGHHGDLLGVLQRRGLSTAFWGIMKDAMRNEIKVLIFSNNEPVCGRWPVKPDRQECRSNGNGSGGGFANENNSGFDDGECDDDY